MAEYGGTDTRGLGEAESSSRKFRLQQSMDAAERRHAEGRQDSDKIGGAIQGLAQNQQQQENVSKGRELEAARSGLEYDPDSKKYRETDIAQQERTFKQGKATAEFELEKGKATSDVLQRQQQLNQQGKQIEMQGEEHKHGMAMRQQDMRLKAAGLDLEGLKEERLAQKALFEQGEERQKSLMEADKLNDTQLEKLTELQMKLELGDKDAQNTTDILLQGIASKDPQMKAALDSAKSGGSTSENIGRIRTAMVEMRNQVALKGAARTGNMSGLVDPTSPTMQRFYQYREPFKMRMETDMEMELRYVQSLPEGERERAKKTLRLTNKSQEDRIRLLNQAAAQDFLEIEMARAAYAGRGAGGGQSGPGGGPPTKLGQPSQQQQLPAREGQQSYSPRERGRI